MRVLLPAVFAVAFLAMAVNPASAQETIPNDVTVSFTVCLEGTGDGTSSGAVCVIGNAAAIGSWGTGVDMTNTEGNLWQVDVVFPSGTDAAVEYKYKKDACSDWEGSGNRMITLPTDGSTTMVLDADSYNQVTPIGCGLAETLATEHTVCFQVCLDGVEHTGSSCVIGNVAALGSFGTGLELTQIGPNLFQRCVTFPAGTSLPIEYKFQVDDCATWESLSEDPFANRVLDLTEASPSPMTVPSVWNNGEGSCDAVPAVDTSWGVMKARFSN